ncbi:MAG: PAS domain S-box protein [Luteolibacter sp.]
MNPDDDAGTALRLNERRLAAVAENLAEGLILGDADGNLVHWNPAALRMFGFTPDTVLRSVAGLAETFEVRTLGDNRLLAVEERPFARIRRGETLDKVELKVRRLDQGWERIFAYSGARVAEDGGSGFFFISTVDITKQWQAEEKVRASEERYRSLASVLTNIPWATDGTGAAVAPQLEWGNYTGLPWEKHQGFNWTAAIHPDDLDTVLSKWKQAIEVKSTYQVDFRIWHAASNGYHHVESTAIPLLAADGTIMEWVGSITDVHERKVAETLLRDSERRLGAVFDNLSEAIVFSDSLGNLNQNAAAIEMFGYASKDDTYLNVNELADVFEVRTLEDNRLLTMEEWPLPRVQRGETLKNLELKVLRPGRDWERIICYSGVRVADVGGSDLSLISASDVTQRRQAEAALRQSEKRLAAVVENLSEGLILGDASGDLTQWNPAALEMFGYTSENETLRNLAEFTDTFEIRSIGNDRPLPVEEWPLARIGRGEALKNLELRIRRLDLGWERILSFSGARVMNVGGTDLSFVSTTDHTQRRKAQEELRASEERYRTLVSVLTDIPWTTNPEGEFIEPQPLWAAYTGMSWEDYRGYGWTDSLHPDDREAILKVWKHSMATKTIYRMEGRRWHAATGEYRYYVACAVPIFVPDGSVKEWVGTFTDVHERKVAEVQLHAREAMLRSITDHANVGMVMVTRERTYAFANAAYLRIHGIEEPDIVGRRLADVQPEIYESQIAPRIDRALAGEQVEDEVFIPQRGDRPGKWLAVTVDPPVDTVHGPCAIVVLVDITIRKQAEQQILRINEELEQRVSERTAALAAANRDLESFSYSVSHDLRAPLRALDGFSQILLLDHSDRLDEQGRDYLTRIRAAAQRMDQLIMAMLQLGRVTRGELQFETLDLSALARSVADELQGSSPERVVGWDIEAGLTTRGDPWLLRVLLRNLLGNAWKYTSKNTTARIEFGALDEAAVRTWYVRDDGAGFDPKYSKRLFAPFQRLHSLQEFEGIGVGLATVQRIVTRHGGMVRAEGSPGHGATFHFTLAPASPSSANDQPAP